MLSPVEYEWEIILIIVLQGQARENVKENNTWHIVNEILNQIFLDCVFFFDVPLSKSSLQSSHFRCDLELIIW